MALLSWSRQYEIGNDLIETPDIFACPALKSRQAAWPYQNYVHNDPANAPSTWFSDFYQRINNLHGTALLQAKEEWSRVP